MQKIVSLCKRRGFVFQSSEIYGGLKSCYDYGPLGTELKRNVADAWWKAMTRDRDDVVGIDAAIIMHPKVWQASGHLDGFSDPLVDCLNCKERFRADKAPKVEVGTAVTYQKGGQKKGASCSGEATRDYVCPGCGAPTLSDERTFNLMFRTNLGPVDPMDEAVRQIAALPDADPVKIKELIDEASRQTAVYLRPETAQGIFVQYLNVQQSLAMKIPFGIAQIGKSFRNEIVTEHFIFRSCEFEQMEMEFFCEPGTEQHWLKVWCEERLAWHKKYLNHPDNLRLRRHEGDELAHYSNACFDVEYKYPWGWDELEGISSRTDFDLQNHIKATGVKLSYFDQNTPDPETGKPGWRYVPYVIEPAAGLTRAVLCILVDAYTEEQGTDHAGQTKTRVFLKLHPSLAPYKAAVLPLVKKDGQPERAGEVAKVLRAAGLHVAYDDKQSIGKRYAKHDEIGTPYCITIDNDTLSEGSLDQGTLTLRNRDDASQERLTLQEVTGRLVSSLQR